MPNTESARESNNKSPTGTISSKDQASVEDFDDIRWTELSSRGSDSETEELATLLDTQHKSDTSNILLDVNPPVDSLGLNDLTTQDTESDMEDLFDTQPEQNTSGIMLSINAASKVGNRKQPNVLAASRLSQLLSIYFTPTRSSPISVHPSVPMRNATNQVTKLSVRLDSPMNSFTPSISLIRTPIPRKPISIKKRVEMIKARKQSVVLGIPTNPNKKKPYRNSITRVERATDPSLSATQTPRSRIIKTRRATTLNGINNPGNQCYSIAVLQMLMLATDFMTKFRNQFEKKRIEDSNPSLYPMSSVLMHLRETYQTTLMTPHGIDFTSFQQARYHHLGLSKSRQECAAEFLEKFLTILQEETEFDTLMESTFQIEVKQDLTCTACGLKKDPIYDKSNVLTISLSEQELPTMSLAEVIERDLNSLGALLHANCETWFCREKGFQSSRCVTTAPSTLLLHMKRFRYTDHLQKRFDRITIPPVYEMEIMSPGETITRSVPYVLKAVIVHMGPNIHSGHYTCYVKGGDGKWTCCSDESIFEVRYETIREDVERKCYIIMYSRGD